MSEERMGQKMEMDKDGYMDWLDQHKTDCSSDQFIREFTYNGIEAVEHFIEDGGPQDYKGKVIVDFDANSFANSEKGKRLYKMCFIDNGIGMTPEQMLQYLRKTACSGPHKNKDNHGTGAKISAMPKNRMGLLFYSWVNGKGSMASFKYFPEDGAYAAVKYKDDDDMYHEYIKFDDKKMVKPEWIDKNGTMVVLMGNEADADTMDKKTYDVTEGTTGAQQTWICEYLHRRYYEIPEYIELRARIGYKKKKESTRHAGLIIVKDLKSQMERWREQSGEVQLDGALVKWYILKRSLENDKGKMIKRAGHGREFLNGHIAAIHKREVYDLDYRGKLRFNSFGIHASKDIVLHIFPEPEENWKPDAKRDQLRRVEDTAQKALPWEDWGKAFREQFPKALDDYQEQKLGELDNSKDLEEKIKELWKDYKLPLGQPSKKGKEPLDDASSEAELPGGGGPPADGEGHRKNKGGKHKGKDEENPVISIAHQIKKSGSSTHGEAFNQFKQPNFQWVKADDEKAQVKDRAAEYSKGNDTIFANEEYCVLRDWVRDKKIKSMFSDLLESAIVDSVKKVFERRFKEVVLGMKTLAHRRHWNDEHIEKALTPEALSAAVATRVSFRKDIEKELEEQKKQI